MKIKGKAVNSYLINNYDVFLLVIVLIIFVFYKYSLLNLPYYWDEAWSYKPAVEEMYKSGLSLLPNSISVENYKGHPLFFYFSSALWLKLFGNTIFSTKVFALTISVLLLFVIFLLTKLLTKNKIVSFFSVIILASQSVFIAQSTLLLPEIMLALLSLTSVYFYFTKNKLGFSLFAAILLLTKETGAVLLFTIIVFDVFTDRKNIANSFVKTLVQKIYLIIPIIPVLAFFILQKIKMGWFFYPEHINFISINNVFFEKFNGYFSYLFIYQSRNVISLGVLLIIIYSIIYKTKFDKKFIYLSGLFIINYLIFSSINFYSTRYVLSLIPFFIISSVLILNSVVSNKYLKITILTIYFGTSILYSQTHFKDSDHNNGYENAVIVQKQMVNYCEKNNLQNKNITTHFLMYVNLTDSIVGYLSKQNKFKNVITYKITDTTDYAIISSNEFDNNFDKEIKLHNGKLIKEFSRKQAWCRIYSFTH